jgi:hypothetical protein
MRNTPLISVILSYELDQLIEMKLRRALEIEDPLKRTEYTVGRMLAHFLFPAIEKNVLLRYPINL